MQTQKETSVQVQVWKRLQTNQQKAFVAEALRPLKKQLQEDLCLGILAYLKFGIVRQFEEDRWLANYFKGIIIFLMAERDFGKL